MTFLKTGVEVLHPGLQHAESDAWPIEHWREHKERWRLHTPVIDALLNQSLDAQSLGESVDCFVLFLEIANFESWGGPPAFHPATGKVSYRPKHRELLSVGQMDWTAIGGLTLKQQYTAFQDVTLLAIEKAALAPRKPRHFDFAGFSAEVARLLAQGSHPR